MKMFTRDNPTQVRFFAGVNDNEHPLVGWDRIPQDSPPFGPKTSKWCSAMQSQFSNLNYYENEDGRFQGWELKVITEEEYHTWVLQNIL